MNKPQKSSSHHEVAEQITNNTTGWIGSTPGNKDHIVKGQTFMSDKAGDLHTIEVFSNVVTSNGNVVMTLHDFDSVKQSWGPVLGSASVEFKKADTGKWIAFSIPGLHLDKGQSYGFRLESEDSYIGVGEAAGSSKHPPFKTGQEWQFSDKNKKGACFSYFSLAFKVGINE